jgi:hypothetical protein
LVACRASSLFVAFGTLAPRASSAELGAIGIRRLLGAAAAVYPVLR